uniref:Peptidase S1 domain-containing protein n=1 Tax=Strigamia maritima TaxID=126957 RepID=T1J1Z4_STRMM
MFVWLLLLTLAFQAIQGYPNAPKEEENDLEHVIPVRNKRQDYYYYRYPYWYYYRRPARRTTTTTTRRPVVNIPTSSHKPNEIPTSTACPCTRRFKREDYDRNMTDTFRIVGGTATSPHAYPQMALLIYDKSQQCGGTILNEEYILTAAHCVAGNNDPSKYDVTVGAYDLNDVEANRKTVSVKKVIEHTGFNTRTFQNDIALLQLSNPLVFNSDVKATCIPLNKKTYADDDGVAVGWGRTAETGSSSRVLREVTVPILSNIACQRNYASLYTIYDTMICAGYQSGGKDTCAGDSGGPLFAEKDQVGVTSFGLGCARREKPGVYTRVTSYIDWINDNVKTTGCGTQAKCSRRPIQQRNENQFRILGGNPATPYNYPEMVLVIYNQMTVCGGTILNQQYIVTAAHCAEDTNASLYTVLAGTYNIRILETSRRILRVKRVILHPGFNRRTYNNDIALLELRETLVFNSYIQPTCMPLRIRSYNGIAAMAVGWGKTTQTGSMSNILKEVTMPIVSQPNCQNSFGSHQIYNSMICAGVQQAKDTCGGDSGGPLFVWSAQHGVLKQRLKQVSTKPSDI